MKEEKKENRKTGRRWRTFIPAVIMLFSALVTCSLTSDAQSIRDGTFSETRGKVLEGVGEQYDFLWEPELVDMVREMGEKISMAYGAPKDRFRFYILSNPDVNAFIAPSGDIFIFAGQLFKLKCPDELAGVLAHEMAHREADHFGEIKRKSTLITLPAIAAMILSQGEEAVIAGAIAVAQSYQLHWSREMEEEADFRAINALKKASFDPLGMVGALRVIEESEQLMPTEVPDHLSTHPPTAIRRASLEAVLGKTLEEAGWSPSIAWSWVRLKAIVKGVTSKPEDLLREWDSSRDRIKTARDHQLVGLYLFKGGHYRQALFEMEQALPDLEKDGIFLADIGAVCYYAGKSEKARNYLERAQKMVPEYSYPHFYLAEMESEAGRVDGALRLYQKALDGRPELPEAHYRYGALMAERQRQGESAYHYGVAALLRGRFKEAYSFLKEAGRELGGNPFWKARIESRLSALR